MTTSEKCADRMYVDAYNAVQCNLLDLLNGGSSSNLGVILSKYPAADKSSMMINCAMSYGEIVISVADDNKWKIAVRKPSKITFATSLICEEGFLQLVELFFGSSNYFVYRCDMTNNYVMYNIRSPPPNHRTIKYFAKNGTFALHIRVGRAQFYTNVVLGDDPKTFREQMYLLMRKLYTYNRSHANMVDYLCEISGVPNLMLDESVRNKMPRVLLRDDCLPIRRVCIEFLVEYFEKTKDTEIKIVAADGKTSVTLTTAAHAKQLMTAAVASHNKVDTKLEQIIFKLYAEKVNPLHMMMYGNVDIGKK
jgi:hypothetical protein